MFTGLCIVCGKEIVLGNLPHDMCNPNDGSKFCSRACKEQYAIKQERDRKEKRVKDLPAFMRKASVPERYVGVKPVEDKYLTGSWYLWGDVGTGKTHLACQIVAARILALHEAPSFITMAEFMVMLQSVDISKKDEYIRTIAHWRGLLVMDDCGAEKLTDYVRQVYYHIINHRYNNLLDTVLTANVGVKELDEQVGERVASRIGGYYTMLKLDGDDRRLRRDTATGR